MRKALTIFLCMTYLAAASGVLLNMHYCGGHLSSVSLAFADAKCACGRESKKESCCKDEHKFFKVSDAHKGFSNLVPVEGAKLLALLGHSSSTASLIPEDFHSQPALYVIPPKEEPPLYDLYCVYRI